MNGPVDDGFALASARLGGVTVVVPVYNGAATLARCLAPLVAFARASSIAEVIVVDDGSTDDSARIAADAGARVLASGGRLGPGGARNRGAEEARGDVLWFVDADVVVHDDAARVLADALARTGADAVFGTYDEAPGDPGFLSQYKNLAHRHQHCSADPAAETFWAGCGAVRARAFADAGGFDARRYPRPSIEDVELGLRLRARGFTIRIEPRLEATHLKRWRFADLVRTDLRDRALPWTALIVEGRMPAVLNTRPAELARAALAWALALSLPAAATGFVPAWTPLALYLAGIVAQPGLFALFLRARGFAFALGAIAFHQVHYLYASAAFVAARLGWTASRAVPSSTSSKA